MLHVRLSPREAPTPCRIASLPNYGTGARSPSPLRPPWALFSHLRELNHCRRFGEATRKRSETVSLLWKSSSRSALSSTIPSRARLLDRTYPPAPENSHHGELVHPQQQLCKTACVSHRRETVELSPPSFLFLPLAALFTHTAGKSNIDPKLSVVEPQKFNKVPNSASIARSAGLSRNFDTHYPFLP